MTLKPNPIIKANSIISCTDEIKQDPTALFPRDVMIKEIFSRLSLFDLGKCCLVSKKWKELSSHDGLRKEIIYRDIAFNKNEWTRYFGDSGNEPVLPQDIYKILTSRCQFWPNEFVIKTTKLVLVPETIIAEQLSLMRLETCAKPLNDRAANAFSLTPEERVSPFLAFRKALHCPTPLTYKKGYKNDLTAILKEHGNTPFGPAHWILLTKVCIPNSRNESFEEQRDLIQNNTDYRVPRLSELVSGLFAHYAHSGEYLLSFELSFCQETTNRVHLAVGSFTEGGLEITDGWLSGSCVGMMAVRDL